MDDWQRDTNEPNSRAARPRYHNRMVPHVLKKVPQVQMEELEWEQENRSKLVIRHIENEDVEETEEEEAPKKKKRRMDEFEFMEGLLD